MAEAGADILVPHMGLTTGGAIGAHTALKLEDCPKLIDEWAEAARRVPQGHHRALPRRPDRDARGRRPTSCATRRTCNGFYGASSMERLPTEVALTARTREFKSITF